MFVSNRQKQNNDHTHFQQSPPLPDQAEQRRGPTPRKPRHPCKSTSWVCRDTTLNVQFSRGWCSLYDQPGSLPPRLSDSTRLDVLARWNGWSRQVLVNGLSVSFLSDSGPCLTFPSPGVQIKFHSGRLRSYGTFAMVSEFAKLSSIIFQLHVN
jgi:hypothetical protein